MVASLALIGVAVFGAGTPATAATSPTVTVTPSPVCLGAPITISGTGWSQGPALPHDVFIAQPGFGQSLIASQSGGVAFTVAADGTFSISAPTLADAPNGTYQAYVIVGAGDPTPYGPQLSAVQCGSTAPPTIINGVNVGWPSNGVHLWGTCSVQDFNGGALGHVIVDFAHGVNIVSGAMLAGWIAQGGAPVMGCAVDQESNYADGTRQDFDHGSLYWRGGMATSGLITWTDLTSAGFSSDSGPGTNFGSWNGYIRAGSNLSAISARWTVPAQDCSAANDNPTAMAQWVGFGGYLDLAHLPQLGTYETCNISNYVRYGLFWQLNPKSSQHTISTVRPGDSVWAIASYDSGTGLYTLTAYVNARVVFQHSFSAPSSASHTVECIVEDPQHNGTVVRWLNFGQVQFDTCDVTTSGGPTTPIFVKGAATGTLTRESAANKGWAGLPLASGDGFAVHWWGP